MILYDKIKISINSGSQIKYYKSKGYDVKIGDEIEIEIKELPLKSSIKIDVMCDICGNVKKIGYRYYLLSLENGNYYSCNKCINVKNKKTRYEIYGDENYNNVLKQQKTCVKKFGTISYTKTKEYLEKTEKTHMLKYGKKYYYQTDDFKIKAKCTCIKKYNKEHYSQTEESVKKSENTCLDRYGETCYSKTKECKKKVKQTSLEKYGYEYYSSSIECRNRVKKTCLDRYGVEHCSQNVEIFNRQRMSAFKMKKYRDLTYQGTYELDFLENYYEKIKIEKPVSLKYKHDEKIKVYHPDFYLPEYNLIVEIKSLYTYEIEKDKNECKKFSALENGYNFIFIIDKDYTDFNHIIH